jgi:hypothetical protein
MGTLAEMRAGVNTFFDIFLNDFQSRNMPKRPKKVKSTKNEHGNTILELKTGKHTEFHEFAQIRKMNGKPWPKMEKPRIDPQFSEIRGNRGKRGNLLFALPG